MKTNYSMESRLWLFMPSVEEHDYYNEICDRIINNPRFYLDNLDNLSVFRVSFIKYSKKKKKAL